MRRPPASTLFPYAPLSQPIQQPVREPVEEVAITCLGELQFPLAPTLLGFVVLGFGDDLVVAELRQRSEEHTSELQSRQYLVCRLLLEQKTHITLKRSVPAV